MPQNPKLVIQVRDAHCPLRQEGPSGIAETTFTMAAIPPELFAEIPQELADNASGMFCQLRNLSHPVDIVSFPDLETLNRPSLQSRRV